MLRQRGTREGEMPPEACKVRSRTGQAQLHKQRTKIQAGIPAAFHLLHLNMAER